MNSPGRHGEVKGPATVDSKGPDPTNPYDSTHVEDSESARGSDEPRPWILMTLAVLFGLVNGAMGLGMVSQAVEERSTPLLLIATIAVLLPSASLLGSVVLFATRRYVNGDRLFAFGFIALGILWGFSILSVLFG